MMNRPRHSVRRLAAAALGAAITALVCASPALAAGYYPVGDWPSVTRLTQPAAVAVAPLSGEVFVADGGGRRIAVYDSNGQFLREFDGRDAPGERLVQPSAVLVGPDTLVYVADKEANRVSVFRTDGSFVDSWGGTGSGSGQFSGPAAIVLTADGQVVVADRFNNRIQVFTPDGVFVRVLPIPTLHGPSALALDGQDLYVTEPFYKRVRVFNLTTGAVVREWGTFESGGSTKSRYSAALGGLAFDQSTNRVYVSDGGVSDPPDNRPPVVERVVPNSVPAPGVVEAMASGFTAQGGIALHAVHLYVADTAANKVVRFAVNDMPTSTPATFAPLPAAVPTHLKPNVVALGPDGSVYVAEQGASRVRKFSASGEYQLTFQQPTPPMSRPSGILADHGGPLGEVYVSDTGNNRLLAYSPDGALLGVVGTQGSAKGQYLEPKGLAKAGAGYIAVVDAGNKRVQLIAPAQHEGDEFGRPSLQEPFGSASSLSSPTAVAWMEIEGENRFLVVDQSLRRISVFSDGGTYLQTSNILGPSGGFSSPQGICVGPDGESFLVADAGSHLIQQFSAATRAHMGVIGSPGYSPGGLTSPHSMAVAADRTLIVADTGNDRVVRFGYDATEPVVDVTGDVSTWVTGSGTVSLVATDSGSGVAQLEYSVRNPQLVTGTWKPYTEPVTVTGNGIWVIAYRATDAVGNVRQGAVEVWVDTVNPVGTTVFAGGAPSAKSGEVSVLSTVSDSGSGVVDMRLGTTTAPGDWVPYSATGSISVAGEGATTLQAQYRDRVGNILTVTRSINVDDSGPSTSIAGLPTGYAPGTVTLTLNAMDDYSAVDSVKYRVDGGSELSGANGAKVTISGDGSHTVTAYAVDSLGNVGPQVEHTFRISELSAGGVLSLAGGAPVVGTRTVNVTTTAKGAIEAKWSIDGVAREYGPIPVPWQVTFPGDGVHELAVTFRDVNGYERTLRDSVTVDLSPPETTILGVPGLGGSLTPVSLSFSARDAHSRVATTYYSVDGAPLQPYVATSPATRFEVAGNGTHLVRFHSVDEFGNTEIQQSVQFDIDDNPARGSFSVIGASGDFVGGKSAVLDIKVPYVREMRYRVENGAWSAWQPWAPTLQIGIPTEGIVQIDVSFNQGDFGYYEPSRRVRVDWTAPTVARASFAPRSFTLSRGVMRVDLRGTADGADPAALLGPPSGVDSWIWRVGRNHGTAPATAGVSTATDVRGVGRGYSRVSAALVDKVGNVGVKSGWIRVSAGSRPKVPSTARRYRRFTVSGSVPIAGPGASHTVQLYKRNSSGRWVLSKSYTVKPVVSGSTAKITKRVSVGRGSYRVVMYSKVGLRQVMGAPSRVVTVK